MARHDGVLLKFVDLIPGTFSCSLHIVEKRGGSSALKNKDSHFSSRTTTGGGMMETLPIRVDRSLVEEARDSVHVLMPVMPITCIVSVCNRNNVSIHGCRSFRLHPDILRSHDSGVMTPMPITWQISYGVMMLPSDASLAALAALIFTSVLLIPRSGNPCKMLRGMIACNA